MAAKRNSEAVSDREIVMTRMFDAPREIVWKAWTDPKQIKVWWGPRGFTTTTHEKDVRPGGLWRFIMHGPDGTDYPNKIVYTELVKPERLVYDHGGDAGADDVQFQVTVRFAEACRKTKASGAVEGGNQTLDRLGEYLTRML